MIKKMTLMAMLATLSAASHAVVFTHTFTLSSDAFSGAGFGSPDNTRTPLDLDDFYGYSNYTLIGVGWNVNISTVGASWLSESGLAFGSSSNQNQVVLTPGFQDDFSGALNYSNTIVDLVGLNLAFALDGDNVLDMEFIESFDDAPGADAIWAAGSSVDLQFEAVPEPGTMTALALGAAALGRRRRKA